MYNRLRNVKIEDELPEMRMTACPKCDRGYITTYPKIRKMVPCQNCKQLKRKDK